MTSTAVSAPISCRNAGPCPPGSAPGDPCIPFPATTQDSIDDLDQFTQEIRIASQASEQLFWQAGVYYFDSKFSVTTDTFIPTFIPRMIRPPVYAHDRYAREHCLGSVRSREL